MNHIFAPPLRPQEYSLASIVHLTNILAWMTFKFTYLFFIYSFYMFSYRVDL